MKTAQVEVDLPTLINHCGKLRMLSHRFVFYPGAEGDYDIISDFDPSVDKIVLENAHLSNLSANDPIMVHNTSGGSWIDVFGSVIFVMDVTAAELGDDVFVFA